jgi:hypothetical protein
VIIVERSKSGTKRDHNRPKQHGGLLRCGTDGANRGRGGIVPWLWNTSASEGGMLA